MNELKTGSLIEMDIQDIISTDNPWKEASEYEIILHTPYKDIDITYLKLIETVRNYSKSIGDEIYITFNMLGGDFILDVYPYRDNLELSITELSTNKLKVLGENRYKLVMVNNNANVYGSKYTAATREDLNKSEIVRVVGQCVDRVVEALRITQVEGIYENTTLKEIMTAEFKEKIANIQLDGENVEVDIDIVEPHNNNTIEQLVIPSGIYALDFPSYLQNTVYGVYNANIGTYIQKIKDRTTLFVYPLYDVNRFDNSEASKMVVYFTNNLRYNAIDNTFKMDGKVLKILAGGSLRSVDNAENDFMSEGDGYIRVLPEQMMNRNAVVTNDSMNLDSSTHLEGTKFKDRRDGADKPVFLGNEVNMYKYRSGINRATMGTYQFQWYYSAPELIYPGMPVQYIYEDGNGNVNKLEGVVQVVISKYDKLLKSVATLITFLAKKPIVYNEEPYDLD